MPQVASLQLGHKAVCTYCSLLLDHCSYLLCVLAELLLQALRGAAADSQLTPCMLEAVLQTALNCLHFLAACS